MAILKRNQHSNSDPKNEASKKAAKMQVKKSASHLIKGTVSTGLTRQPIVKIDIPQAKAQPSLPEIFEYEEAELLDPSKIQAQLLSFRTAEIEKINKELDAYYQEKMKEIEIQKNELLEEAYQEGVAQGKSAGYEAIKPQLENVLHTLSEIQLQKNTILEQFKPDLLKMAVEMAKKITAAALEDNPVLFENTVNEALTKITDKEKVVIRVNPKQLETIRNHKEAIQKFMPDIKNLEIQEDNKIDSGGCIIETKMGYVDATLPVKIETLNKLIFERYKEENA